MLVEMSIANLAVIESVHIHCGRGFHVLTGETGAGKSMIVDALGLLIGGRGSADLVRHGASKAEIEGLFDVHPDHQVWNLLEKCGIPASCGEYLIIRRELSASGKSTARINGHLVNLALLKEVGESIVNIHGQHEHQSLLKAEKHIDWLDLYGEREILHIKGLYLESYNKYVHLKKELDELQSNTQKTLQLMDLYKYQCEEISAASLKADEEEGLAEEKRKLSHAEKLIQSVSDSYDFIYGTNKALDQIGKVMKKLDDAVEYDKSVLQPLLDQIQNVYYQLEDAAYQLRDYRDGVEYNPGRLDRIEERLDLIASLRRKYGDHIEDILNYYRKIQAELEHMENKDEKIAQLQSALDQERRILCRYANDLSEKRKQIAEKLSKQVENELKDLHMERTQFQALVNFETDEEGLEIEGQKVRFSKYGIDQIEFMISANPGEPLRSLSKVASGGELSRIMLAMKTIFAHLDGIPVLVFDEVDTGVSGRAAQAIAEKISTLSDNCQVFCITHLPQVACMADEHLTIYKLIEDNRTQVNVKALDQQGRIQELARMLGGVEVTETTERHAREMILLANEKKSSI
jgi:DNA repair protein RecN (Recombination protein N)